MEKSRLGHSIWRGPELDEVEEEGVASFSFLVEGVGV